MRNKLNSLWLLLFLLVPMMSLGQDLFIPDQLSISGRLNLVIAADTAGAGAAAWQAGTRVYVLQRDGIYPVNAQFQLGNNRKLKIRCAYPGEYPAAVDDLYDPAIFAYDAVPGTTGRPPGTVFILGGTNNEVNLDHIVLSAFDEDQPGEVDGVQGNLINIVASGGTDGKARIIIDHCILKSSNGNHIRTDGRPGTIRVLNSIFADMGNNATSNYGAGKGFDVRANQVDTFDVRNCTFVNGQDRIIRHYTSTAAIVNLTFNNNTVVNSIQYHGLLSLGKADLTGSGKTEIKNNLMIDVDGLGLDTAAVRQSEYNDHGELDAFGKPRLVWIMTEKNTAANLQVSNNYYAISDSGRVMYNMPFPKGPLYKKEAPALTWGMNARLNALSQDTLLTFQRIGIKPVNVPDLMTRKIRWIYRPRAEGGAEKGKGGNFDPLYTKISDGNWTYDYNRKTYQYYRDTLNCNFDASISVPSNVGDPRWHQNSTFTYTLTVNATNGSVVKYPDDATYAANSIVQLTATPAAGYIFDSWSGDATGSANPLTISMTGSKTITANFVTGTMYTLTTSGLPAGKGDVVRVPDFPSYPAGTNVTLTPAGGVGYGFRNWSGDASGSTVPLIITMDGPKNIVANFGVDSVLVTTAVGGGVGGTCVITNAKANNYYNVGSYITVTAQPASAGQKFTGWSGDPILMGINTQINPLGANNFAIVNAMTITANFTNSPSTQLNLTQPTIPGRTADAITKTPNFAFFNPTGGYPAVGDPVSIAARNSTLPASCPPGYEFKSWAGDTSGMGLTSAQKTTTPLLTLMNITRNITATYGLKKYALTTNSSLPAGVDSVSRSPWSAAATTLDTATVKTLQAYVKTGYHFVKWSCIGGAKQASGAAFDSTVNPTSIMMTRAMTVTAVVESDAVTIPCSVVAGWNLVAVPNVQTVWTPNVVFPGIYGPMFKFQGGGYVNAAPSLVNGLGYWANYLAPGTINLTGAVIPPNMTVSLAAGWNMIGGREVPVLKTALVTNPAGVIYGPMFVFQGGGYVSTPNIPITKGVWIFVLQACTLTIP